MGIAWGVTMSTRTSGALLLLASLSFSFAAACGGSVDSTGGSSSGTPGTGPGSLPPPGSLPVPGVSTSGGPPPPAPIEGSWSLAAGGCSNFTVYASHTSGRRFLVVQATKEKLGIASLGDTVTINLASKGASGAASVYADTLPRAPAEAPYCTDFIVNPQGAPALDRDRGQGHLHDRGGRP